MSWGLATGWGGSHWHASHWFGPARLADATAGSGGARGWEPRPALDDDEVLAIVIGWVAVSRR